MTCVRLRYANRTYAGSGKLREQKREDPVRSAGLYTISETERLPGGGIRFITSASGLADEAGFVYYPEGEPPALSALSFTAWRIPLGGGIPGVTPGCAVFFHHGDLAGKLRMQHA